MEKRLFFSVALWNWVMLAVSLLMTVEYARLTLFTETATYRIFVLLAWIGISLFTLVRIDQQRRQVRSSSPKITNQERLQASGNHGSDRSP